MQEKINNALRLRNGKLISNINEYKNAKTKLKWQCAGGHIFVSDWNHVQQGKWCPYCAGKYITIEQIQNIASNKGGKFLSKTYTKCIDKFLWECKLGHQWFASLNSVKNNNSWCPHCTTSVGENICRKYLEHAFDEKFIKIKPAWLINDGGFRLELDGYCGKLGIAFEYNGRHHYVKSYKDQDLINTQNNDKIKKNICKNRGIILLTIKDKDVIDKKTYIKNTLIQELNRHNLSHNSMVMFDINDSEIYSYNPMKELHNVAALHNGKCLSSEYNGVHYKYKWQCENNHVWEATFTPIKTGEVWCAKCRNVSLMSVQDLTAHLTNIKDRETDAFNKRILAKTINILLNS